MENNKIEYPSLSSNEESKTKINENISENKEKKSISPQKNNKIREDLKSFIMDNRRKIYVRLEGMENEEELQNHNEKDDLNVPHRNIGNNIVLFNKFIIGSSNNLLLFIITIIGISLTWFGWVIFSGNFYSKTLYKICGISYFFTMFFMIGSFLIEPGIIPRRCPEFSESLDTKGEEKDNQIDIHVKNEIPDNNKEEENITYKIKEKNDNNHENKENDKDDNKNNDNSTENDNNKEIVKDKDNNNIENNEENQNNESKGSNDSNENNETNEEIVPRIFRQRKCTTCHIFRPPGASHCRICDNCVKGFDHHCYYISNCVGKRNHKFFYLFLFWGSLCGIQVTIFSLNTFFHVFIVKSNETIYILYKSNKILFFLSIILMLIALIYLYCGVRDIFCLGLFFLIGLGIFILIWYKYIYTTKKDIPCYYNPFIFVVLISAISFCCFVTSTFFGQTIFICSGYTIKQSRSIRNELIDLSYRNLQNKINQKYIKNKSFKDKLNNFINFFKADIEKSLILPERDLIY